MTGKQIYRCWLFLCRNLLPHLVLLHSILKWSKNSFSLLCVSAVTTDIVKRWSWSHDQRTCDQLVLWEGHVIMMFVCRLVVEGVAAATLSCTMFAPGPQDAHKNGGISVCPMHQTRCSRQFILCSWAWQIVSSFGHKSNMAEKSNTLTEVKALAHTYTIM